MTSPAPFRHQIDDTQTFTPDDAAPLVIDVAFIRCIARLEELIDSETETLRSCAPLDFESLNLRKTHALLEFTRVAREMPEKVSSIAERRLTRLRGKLAENAELLDQRLQAMLEITDVIVASIRHEESDGTYSISGATRR